ncbi:MAG: type II secretion system F family protein [Parcubacteria group bacterium]|nr:type II secretion system F family protein [Parcubacteria group bacterium]
MKFNYQARTAGGVVQTGTVEAPTKDTAIETLHRYGLIILEIAEEKKGFGLSLGSELPFFNKVKSQDIVVFSRQLAVLFDAQVPLVQALRTLAEQSPPTLKKIVVEIAGDVDSGTALSQSLEKFSKVFSFFYVSVVRAGEASGRLQEVLNYLADHEERSYDLNKKVKGALTYPIFIISSLVAVGAAMMIFVVPQLTSVLEESGQELPVLTKLIIALSDFLRGYWWLGILIIIGIVVGIMYALKTPAGRDYWDKIKLKLPIFGNIFKKIYLARFSENLSTLIKGGIPIIQSLTITADVVGNAVYKAIILKAREEVRRGSTINSVFASSASVPPMVAQMIMIGEQTGRLDVLLNKVAVFFKKDVDNIMENLTSLIQPVLILILGGAAGVLVAAILLPIYNLSSGL